MEEKARLMTIGQVARAAGVATTTLRHYERQGILSPQDRNGVGYRLYDVQAVERMRFIRSAQAVGFSLDDIRTLLSLENQDGKSCQAEVQRLLEKRLADVDEKLRGLKRIQGTLRKALGRCRTSRGECAVLGDLSGRNKQRRRR